MKRQAYKIITLIFMKFSPRIISSFSAVPGKRKLMTVFFYFQILISSILFLSPLLIFAQANDPLFQKANELYKKSLYDSSAAIYSKILESGMVSQEIYFNLGNSLYKTKKIPQAILNYERALKLAPNDEDIKINLALANLFVVDKIVAVPELFYIRWWTSMSNLLSEYYWSLLSIGFTWLVLASAVLFILSQSRGIRKTIFNIGLTFMFLTVFSFLFGKKQSEHVISNNSAIVFDSSVYIKSSPDEKGVDLFILHEGVKLLILDEIGEWKRIRIANGNEGWIKAESIEII